MNKKGELTTTQIVGLILLLVAFVILLLFLFRLNFKEGNEKEVCQASVIARGSSDFVGEVVPLQCRTTYICISANNNKCEEELSNPTRTYKIKTQEQAYQIIADEIADCWWMFGEGQINYAGAEIIPKMYCSLCSQIVFDKSMYEIFPSGKFSQKEIYSYMTKINMSDKQTYSEYIYGTKELDAISGGLQFENVSINNKYYIVTGMSSVFGGAEVAEIGFAAGAVISFIPIGKVVSLIGKPLAKFAGKIIGGIGRASGTSMQAAGGALTSNFLLAPVVNSIIGQQMVAPFMIQLGDPAFKELGCKELTTSS